MHLVGSRSGRRGIPPPVVGDGLIYMSNGFEDLMLRIIRVAKEDATGSLPAHSRQAPYTGIPRDRNPKICKTIC
jgi:hypothetical protein